MTSMPDPPDPRRRELLGTATIAIGAAAFAGTPLAAQPRAAAVGTFVALKSIAAGDLIVSYAEKGPAGGTPVLLFHGWPYDIHTYADAARLLGAEGYRVIVPFLRGYGPTRFRSDDAPRNGQQAAFAADAIALMDALGVERAILGGCDWGARTANVLAALWPERCLAHVSVSGYLVGNHAEAKKPLAPEAERQWWYQFYFATDRGREGYAQNTDPFARLIWQLASPRWAFDEATFARSAAAFANPDHVDIVIHNYRWRMGLVDGERRFDAIEARLAAAPAITVPTITLEGDANGAPHPEPASYKDKFIGPYEHRALTGGIGHNLPQEAPDAFARAIVDAARL